MWHFLGVCARMGPRPRRSAAANGVDTMKTLFRVLLLAGFAATTVPLASSCEKTKDEAKDKIEEAKEKAKEKIDEIRDKDGEKDRGGTDDSSGGTGAAS